MEDMQRAIVVIVWFRRADEKEGGRRSSSSLLAPGKLKQSRTLLLPKTSRGLSHPAHHETNPVLESHRARARNAHELRARAAPSPLPRASRKPALSTLQPKAMPSLVPAPLPSLQLPPAPTTGALELLVIRAVAHEVTSPLWGNRGA
jgi:hypothetical protein